MNLLYSLTFRAQLVNPETGNPYTYTAHDGTHPHESEYIRSVVASDVQTAIDKVKAHLRRPCEGAFGSINRGEKITYVEEIVSILDARKLEHIDIL